MGIDARLSKLQAWFETQEKTLSFAESCTGGHLSAAVTSRPGVSKFFLGSVICYHRQVKSEILGVPDNLILTLGEVSTPVAIYMARGARERLKTDFAVAVTGIAGPTGGTPDKPVGTVCFAIVGPGIEVSKTKRFTSENRQKIQLESVEFAIDFLWDSIHA